MTRSEENREESTQTIDLTGQEAYPMPTRSSVKRHHFRSLPSFTSAYHRIISRQEREIDYANPNIVRERIDVSEERHPNPVRERALTHVSRAYAAIGYTHATLTILVSAICATLLLAVSFAVASDVARKTRDRASDLVASAAECTARIRENNCIVDGDHISHSSYEMAALCKKWVFCARRGRFADSEARSAKIWAETLADIVNTFAERLSTMTVVVVVGVAIVIFMLCSSSAFRLLHNRVVSDDVMTHVPHMPSTPLIGHPHTPHLSFPTRRPVTYKNDEVHSR